ncbi:phage baseplate assembly protein [Pyruvatibacter sp.]
MIDQQTPDVQLTVDGQSFGGWLDVDITRSLRQAASSFVLKLTDRWAVGQVPWHFMPGVAVTVSVDGAQLVNGHVDIVEASIESNKHALTITGRSLTADLVDCAALVPGGQFKGADIASIARALTAPFGISVEAPDAGAVFADVQVRQGESCFALIERLARLRGLLVTDTPAGGLRLVNVDGLGDAARSAHGVREGGNMLTGDVQLDWSRRFSEYIIKAQQAGSDVVNGEGSSAVKARVTDDRVTRYRPYMRVAEAGGDLFTARQRARWAAKTAAARALSATLMVQGWYAEEGPLWEPGRAVAAVAPTLGLDHQLIAETVNFSIDAENGTTTTLGLVPAAALTPEPEKPGSASGKGSNTASGTVPDVASKLEYDWGGLGGIKDG